MPNYDTEYEELERAAKLAEALRGKSGLAQFIPQNRMVGNRFVAPTFGEHLAGAANRLEGGFGLERTRQQREALDTQQMDEFRALSQELNAPRPEGEDPITSNQRRMDVAQRMSQLPRARAYAQQVINQAAGFPERYDAAREAAKERAALAAQQAADRAAAAELAAKADEREKERDRELKRSLAELAAVSAAENRASREREAAARASASAERATAASQAKQDKVDAAAQKRQDKIDKANEGKVKAAESGLEALDNIENNLSILFEKDPKTGAIKLDKSGQPTITKGTRNAVGQWDSMVPSWMQFDDTRGAAATIKSLKDQMTMISLADVKRALGQSVGSMQAQEWEKFQNQIRSLDTDNPDPQFEENLRGVYAFVKKNKTALNKVMSAARDGGEPAVAPAGGPVTPPPGAHIRKFNPATGRLE